MTTPRVSVFTPVHPASLPFIHDCFTSLANQTFKDFEWVIVPNSGLTTVGYEKDFKYDIQVLPAPPAFDGRIGALKRMACDNARGEILVECDCDDRLTPDALIEIVKAFDDPKVMMVYSNCAEFNHADNTPRKYSEAFGWRYRDTVVDGITYAEAIHWEPSPQMMRRIEFAPNHVRAWRSSAYKELGGHDASLAAGDDHELCCRTYVKYGAAGIKHVDKLLYLYRVHGANSSGEFTNPALSKVIQTQTALNYLRHVESMAVRWSKDNQLACINLGGRFEKREGYRSVDLLDSDLIIDLNQTPWQDSRIVGYHPITDSCVGVIRCHHTLEHLNDQISFMNEAYRVLAPGGWLFLEFPSALGRGGFRDPTHKQFMVDESMYYWSNEFYAKFIRPAYKGRFQAARIETYNWQDGTPVVACELIALKDGMERTAGEVLI